MIGGKWTKQDKCEHYIALLLLLVMNAEKLEYIHVLSSAFVFVLSADEELKVE